MCPNHRFFGWFASHHIDDEVSNQSAEVEAAIGAIGEGGQVALGILAVIQRVDRAGQGCLQIAQHHVDPIELRQVARLGCTHHNGLVHAARIDYCRNAAEAIANHAHRRTQAGLRCLAAIASQKKR